jgi:hypothetical protein
MPSDPSETAYTVVIVGVMDEPTRKKVAQTLTGVSDRLPMDRVLVRLKSLPWTITRKATLKKAVRLVKLLEGLGAQMRCIPPLPGTVAYDPAETQILPGTELLTQTQVMSATQFLAVPDQATPSPETAPEPISNEPAVPVEPAPTLPEPAIREDPTLASTQPKRGNHVSRIVIWILVVITLIFGLAGSVVFFVNHLLPHLQR